VTSPAAARPLTPRARRTPASPSPCNHHTGTAATNFHGEQDNLAQRPPALADLGLTPDTGT
jgi:hypothetical protein